MSDTETGRQYERRYKICQTCNTKLVPQRVWNAETKLGRRAMKADGYAKQGVGPHCARCTATTRREGQADG